MHLVTNKEMLSQTTIREVVTMYLHKQIYNNNQRQETVAGIPAYW